MITVDVYVPSVDKEYDFSLDQNVRISTIIEEISEMIAHKEHSELVGEIGDLILCDCGGGRILDAAGTLGANHIQTGSRLLLI